MFEVIISTVHTGRVERKTFQTRDDLDCYIEARQAKWEARSKDSFLSTHRLETRRVPVPAARLAFVPAAAA